MFWKLDCDIEWIKYNICEVRESVGILNNEYMNYKKKTLAKSEIGI